jgi:hypothetical protein
VRDAERDAVITAIEKVLGPNTSREPKVTSEINSIVSQVREGQIIDTKWTRTDKTYEFTVNLALDDREFYTWLSDRGIARRLRAYSILVVMDESLAGLHSGEKTGQVYNAFVGQFQAYDLRILDNSIFRSKYFNNKPLTIEQMSDGGSLARYVACAKVEAEADFFMAGTSNITDQGKNPHTGDNQCNGIVTIRTYSTVDGESIASETLTEEAAGSSSSDCAAMAAKKLANIGGPIIGARFREYWKRRAIYGREHVVTLRGINLSQRVRMAFTDVLTTMPEVESYTQHASGPTQIQCVVTYKGRAPLDQALAKSLVSNREFSNLDSRTEGNHIQLCIGPCRGVESAACGKTL